MYTFHIIDYTISSQKFTLSLLNQLGEVYGFRAIPFSLYPSVIMLDYILGRKLYSEALVGQFTCAVKAEFNGYPEFLVIKGSRHSKDTLFETGYTAECSPRESFKRDESAVLAIKSQDMAYITTDRKLLADAQEERGVVGFSSEGSLNKKHGELFYFTQEGFLVIERGSLYIDNIEKGLLDKERYSLNRMTLKDAFVQDQRGGILLDVFLKGHHPQERDCYFEEALKASNRIHDEFWLSVLRRQQQGRKVNEFFAPLIKAVFAIRHPGRALRLSNSLTGKKTGNFFITLTKNTSAKRHSEHVLQVSSQLEGGRSSRFYVVTRKEMSRARLDIRQYNTFLSKAKTSDRHNKQSTDVNIYDIKAERYLESNLTKHNKVTEADRYIQSLMGILRQEVSGDRDTTVELDSFVKGDFALRIIDKGELFIPVSIVEGEREIEVDAVPVSQMESARVFEHNLTTESASYSERCREGLLTLEGSGEAQRVTPHEMFVESGQEATKSLARDTLTHQTEGFDLDRSRSTLLAQLADYTPDQNRSTLLAKLTDYDLDRSRNTLLAKSIKADLDRNKFTTVEVVLDALFKREKQLDFIKNKILAGRELGKDTYLSFEIRALEDAIDAVLTDEDLMGQGLIYLYDKSVLPYGENLDEWKVGFAIPEDYDPANPDNVYFPYTGVDHPNHPSNPTSPNYPRAIGRGVDYKNPILGDEGFGQIARWHTVNTNDLENTVVQIIEQYLRDREWYAGVRCREALYNMYRRIVWWMENQMQPWDIGYEKALNIIRECMMGVIIRAREDTNLPYCPAPYFQHHNSNFYVERRRSSIAMRTYSLTDMLLQDIPGNIRYVSSSEEQEWELLLPHEVDEGLQDTEDVFNEFFDDFLDDPLPPEPLPDPSLPWNDPFTDIDGLDEYTDINEMLEERIVPENPPTTLFRPDDPATRAEYVTFINRVRRAIELAAR